MTRASSTLAIRQTIRETPRSRTRSGSAGPGSTRSNGNQARSIPTMPLVAPPPCGPVTRRCLRMLGQAGLRSSSLKPSIASRATSRI